MTSRAKPNWSITKGVHWVSAALIACGYDKGLEDISQLADPALCQSEVVFAQAILNIWNVTSVSSLFEDTTLSPIYDGLYAAK